MMQPRRAFTLVEVLVVGAILLTLVGLMWPAISGIRSVYLRGRNGVEQSAKEPSRTWWLETVSHDGHTWVISSAAITVPVTFAHHPDCPCHSRNAESEEK